MATYRIVITAALAIAASAGLMVFPLASDAQTDSGRLRQSGLLQTQPSDSATQPYGSYLGLRLSDIDSDRAKVLKLEEDQGVEVRAVAQGGPADVAGIVPGDVLLTYNGENILSARHIVRLLGETPIGRKVKIQFWREGKMRSTFVTTAAFSRIESPSSDGSAPPNGLLFPSTAITTVIPRPLLVWRDVLLGMEFQELGPQLSDYFGVFGGVLVSALEKGYPADKCGLKAGDVITSVAHKQVLSAHDFASCLRKPGAAAEIVVMRNHKKLDLTLSLPASNQRSP